MDRLEEPHAAAPGSGKLDALVVLGCRVRDGRPSRALKSRLELAHALGRSNEAGLTGSPTTRLRIVLSGGRLWDGNREADVMAEWLVAHGISREALIVEGESLTTRQNARYVAPLLSRYGWKRIGLVTSDFHMPRALQLFRREGTWVEPFSARSNLGFFTHKRLMLRELGARLLGPFEPR